MHRLAPASAMPHRSVRFSGVSLPASGAGTSEALTRFERALDQVGLLRGDPSLVYLRAAGVAALGTALSWFLVPALYYRDDDNSLDWAWVLGVPSALFLLTALFV